MITLNVSADISALKRDLSQLQREQLPFAAAMALTQTAKDVQAEVKKQMPQHFTIRRSWVISGIRIKPATKQDLTALVFSRDPFMGLQETGGMKTSIHRRVFDYGDFLAVPLDARRSKSDVVRKEDWPQNLVNAFILTARDGRRYLAVHQVTVGKKGPRSVKDLRKGANESGTRLMYTLVPKVEVKKRLGLINTGEQVARERFPWNMRAALDRAVSSAR